MMQETYEFKDLEFVTDESWSYHRKEVSKSTCIVIDNGSHSCRAGWSTDEAPRLTFRNLVAKYRGKKENDASSNYFFGNDIQELEDGKWNIRTQFDMNVVTHFDTQEYSFDYIFSHLGINTENRVRHPVCLTEGVCIPNNFRQHMSEMLFECYQVPKVIYGVDSLFSFNYNKPTVEYGIIVSCGYQTTHILPVVHGRFDPSGSRRLNLGGLNMMIYLRQLLQLKFPNQASVLNLSRAQELILNHTHVAKDYFEELCRWQNEEFRKKNLVGLKLPVLNGTTEKDLELRKVQAKRLKEINQRKREEKIKTEEERLRKLVDIKELGEVNPSAFKSHLKAEHLKDEASLVEVMDELKETIANRKAKSVQYYRSLNTEDHELAGINPNVSIEEVEKLVSALEDEKLSVIDKRRSRASKKQALNKRKSYASKERMRILSQLAKSGKNTEKAHKEDNFGIKDEDWDVYKFINKDGSESEEEQEQERLNEIEQALDQYQLLKNKLMIGRGQMYQYLPFDTEQIRVPEVLYQPSMVGIDQEGIVGMIEYVLKNYDHVTQEKMINNIFVTGGLAKLPNFKDRLELELQAILPFESTFNVQMAKDCLLDPWLGAADFLRNCDDLSNVSINIGDYNEKGLGYIKEHQCSNLFVDLHE